MVTWGLERWSWVCPIREEGQAASCEPAGQRAITGRAVLNAVPTALAFMPKLHLCKVLTHSTYRHKQREEYLPGERFHSNRVFIKPQDRDSLGEGKEVLQRHLFSFYKQKESSTFFFFSPSVKGNTANDQLNKGQVFYFCAYWELPPSGQEMSGPTPMLCCCGLQQHDGLLWIASQKTLGMDSSDQMDVYTVAVLMMSWTPFMGAHHRADPGCSSAHCFLCTSLK